MLFKKKIKHEIESGVNSFTLGVLFVWSSSSVTGEVSLDRNLKVVGRTAY